jgi:L-methionine (R)-S-oxide reductase
VRPEAVALAEQIRRAGDYRWVGIYEVGPEEISVVGWSGPAPPEHPSFPKNSGLCGAAAASGSTVVVEDVTKDPRYIPTLGDTRSEMVVPAKRSTGEVVGLIDVESGNVDAFTPIDLRLLEGFAPAVARLLA